MSKIDKLVEDKDMFDDESKALIDSILNRKGNIEKIASMKATAGWKVLDENIRKSLHERIDELVKDDHTIQTLVSLLKLADTHTGQQLLDQEIDSYLPSQ